MDVNELVRKMRMVAADDICLMAQGARALEALARENAEAKAKADSWRMRWETMARQCAALESQLAAVVPVVETARALDEDSGLRSVAGWYPSLVRVREALATLEAANV